MTDKVLIDRSVVEQALSTLEGWGNYDKWVWPESALSTAKKNTAEMIPALRAALEQPQAEQEPGSLIRGLPEGATHIAMTKGKVRSGGQIDVSIRAFKYDVGVLKVYVTDNDNEYPGWRKAVDVFYNLNFPIVPLYTHPQPPRQPLTDVQINDHRLALAYDSEDLPDHWDFKQGVRAAERAHGIGGEK